MSEFSRRSARKPGGRPRGSLSAHSAEIAVELDAIPPDRLVALVNDAIVDLIDTHAWRLEQAVEESERELLRRIIAA